MRLFRKVRPWWTPLGMARHYSPWFCSLMNRLDFRVHCDHYAECRWVAPFGFVPDAACSEHG